ncbi:Bacterial transferase hexapeptide (six repeats) family protein [Clavispora lusitaniae]|uniref:Translation initiation factor eIF2B subunit gamma n=1 Tax=Clavispora lusitaniae (strain ATCC 42720) TaxID=306902 RepID=C4Y6D0_CLAL4|nr:uncharacterized protein CLUG_03713 [Clavispora lusitaniae ATCC 42720]EEQ39585.1 hypothetical protein CLUG_03713 [Clavispora lusitaniae ATCC 42720]KAF7582444.1 Bacterial transferase hexapeptide (six repeats) family protein [Clavispora lusitaniae]
MEFHAVILCGPGKQLTPFSKMRSTGISKALLPVANVPMVEYVLDWCERAFFPKVTLVCDDASAEDIEASLKRYKATKSSSETSGDHTFSFTESISVVQVDSSASGQVLQHLYKTNAISPYEHFVLLPCDFITNLPPQVLIEAYRSSQDTDVGMLVYYKNRLEIEDKKNKIFPKNYTIYTELPTGSSQLLDYYSVADIEFHKALKIRTQMVWSYPNATVSTQSLNSSIFFGNAKKIFEIFDAYPDKFIDTYFATRPLIKVVRDLARKPWQKPNHKSTIGFMMVPEQAIFFRCNNLPVLMEGNRHYLKLQAREGAVKQTAAKEKTAANVGADSIIGENTSLGEKTTVKRTVIGSNCIIGKRVKLTGSIILDNVVIEDDVQLENTVVGHHAIIRSKSKLINCNVESTHDVMNGTQSKGDTLLCLTLEGLVVSDSSSEDASSSEGDSDSDYEEFDEGDYDNSDGLFGY